MDRRQFTLQLYDGKPTSKRMPDDLTSFSGPLSMQHVRPEALWRCSGCLMAWGSYGASYTQDGRPIGQGCDHCKAGVWMADSPAAQVIDDAAGHDFRKCFDSLHPAAAYAIAAAERTIIEGQYVRLTPSCEPHIRAKVRDAVTSVMEQWIGQHRPGKVLRSSNADFLHSDVAVMTLHIGIGYLHQPASDSNIERFVVRYRWVQ